MKHSHHPNPSRIKPIGSRLLTCILPALLAVSPLQAGTEANPDENPPDIVFILLDDLRFDGLSYKGHPYVETPHIDKLRSLGADVANAFVTTSMCCPSRATFLTGTHASQHGVIDNETSEYNPEVTPPLTRYLQEAGYKTALIGKWHMGDSAHPRPYFDYWLSFRSQGRYFDPELNINGERVTIPGYTTDILTDKAIEFIESQPLDQPYFCMLSHKAVHQPFKPAPRHTEAFGADTVDLKPPSWEDDFATKPEWQRREQMRSWRWDWRTRDIEAEVVPERIAPVPFGNWKHYIQQYRCLAAVDDGVGKILKSLKKRGTLENTLIVFTSDNGYFHGEHRRWDKRLAYEESIRIPMVVVHAGNITPGSTVTGMVSNLDFAPTILKAAGVPVPDRMRGRDFGPLLRQEEIEWENPLFYEYWVDLVHSVPTMIATRDDRYKLVSYPELDDIDELYDLQEDPFELTNLAGDPDFADIQTKLKERLLEQAKATGWQPRIFPNNLPTIRGQEGTLVDLVVEDGSLVNRADPTLTFDEKSITLAADRMILDGSGTALQFDADPAIEPSNWPFVITVNVKVEKDGVIVSQAGNRYGFKLFVQDGRPGVSTVCQTWKASQTTIDAPESVLGKWVELRAVIHYNRLGLFLDGTLVDSRPLPQPFKGHTRAPLLVGQGSPHPVLNDAPNQPFKGEIRRLTLQRILIPDLVSAIDP